eukprot:TRINITY_DN51177_c0_g1_i1.p1 TRINITY_DN51177_c0_g1~~TRINITY_DN51177_c0_g1_i1.p1  ORF type:complete len:391 (-),score=77.50 TRINITY_DN51177_c0_g1_i1:333-1418(-)
MSGSIHGDVASAIGQQVEQMILQAKEDSEARVRQNLSVAKSQLQHMEGLIGELKDRVSRCARANGAGAADASITVDRAFLTQKIAQLEQKWGSEVKRLKQDLHRTILAHNHNSDLMRHHRDALDEARRKLDAQTQPKAEQVDAQIEKVDRMLRAGQSKQRALDALTERLTAVEQQVGEMFPNAPMPAPFPPMMPGVGGLPPMLSQAPISQQREQPAPNRAAKKEDPPTEDEVRNRLLQAARAANSLAADPGTHFNAEAPVFIPRGGPGGGPGGVGAEVGGTSTAPAKSEPTAGEDAATEGVGFGEGGAVHDTSSAGDTANTTPEKSAEIGAEGGLDSAAITAEQEVGDDAARSDSIPEASS